MGNKFELMATKMEKNNYNVRKIFSQTINQPNTINDVYNNLSEENNSIEDKNNLLF